MQKFIGDKSAFVLIIATLLVIILIAGQFLIYRQKNRDNAIKAEGRNVVRLLANLPYEQLVPKQGKNTILDLLNSRQAHSDFAYAAIVNLKGQPLAVTATGQAIIPNLNIGNEKSLWVTEHEIPTDNNARTLLEFRAPVLKAGELAGYIRAGYFKPGLELAEIPFLAQLALPIFLLVPLTYLLMGRELKPLKQASVAITATMEKQHINQDRDNNTEFQDFMGNFKRFTEALDQRFDELKQQNFKVKASSLALNYQRQRAESALQAIPDGILIMDEAGTSTFANAKITPLTGFIHEKIVGYKPHEWCKNTEVTQLLSRYQNNSLRLQRSDSVEFTPEHNPANTVSVSAYPLFSAKDHDTICGTLIVFKDRTREVLANQARNQFIDHVAHELKSPLNVIHMYAESLLEDDVDDTQRINSINIINDEVERLSNLIANLLNISKIEAGSIALNLQRVKLNEFLTDTFNSVARSGGNSAKLQFELNLQRELPNIQLDKDLLRVAINNLLTNAVKYNNPGGKVNLSAEETDDKLIITISDTGIGIAETDQAHIFEKFYRSDNDNVTERSGHGLGLALAKEIVDLHQGQLTLQSTVGEGSVFSLELKKTSSFLKSN